MTEFISHNGKILVDTLGRLIIPASLPKLVFEMEGAEFPPTGHVARFLRFNSRSLPQKIFIDFGDGSPIFEEDFTTLNWESPKPLHIYSDSSRKNVTIWFSRSENISYLGIGSATRLDFVGEFPLTIGLYNLDELFLRNLKFESFPLQLSGGNFKILRLEYITVNEINFIPKWIFNSKVEQLMLLGGFDLSDLSISNLEKITNIQGLLRIYFNFIKANESNIPDIFKDIPTLRYINIGNAPISEIIPQLNNCKQITDLHMGYTPNNAGGTNPNITSWGVGIANMPSLTTFSAINCINISTDIVTGIETSGVSSYQTQASYKTTIRVDASILSAYNKVDSLASKTVGNTVLRNIAWVNGALNNALRNATPTGVYQAPIGFVLGSSNGEFANAMEMIYVLTKQYRWNVTVNNSELDNTVTTYNYLS